MQEPIWAVKILLHWLHSHTCQIVELPPNSYLVCLSLCSRMSWGGVPSDWHLIIIVEYIYIPDFRASEVLGVIWYSTLYNYKLVRKIVLQGGLYTIPCTFIHPTPPPPPSPKKTLKLTTDSIPHTHEQAIARTYYTHGHLINNFQPRSTKTIGETSVLEKKKLYIYS